MRHIGKKVCAKRIEGLNNFGWRSNYFVAGEMSISPTFYEQLFRTKVFCTAFLELQFGFVIFWGKIIGAKVACKTMMKLTKGFYFLSLNSMPFIVVILSHFLLKTSQNQNECFLTKKIIDTFMKVRQRHGTQKTSDLFLHSLNKRTFFVFLVRI